MFHFVQLHVPSLNNDCTIQDLAFQVLNPVWGLNFHIRPNMYFCSWSSKTWIQLNMIVKTWQPQVWLHNSRLGFPSLDTFWVKDFPYETFCKTDFFHDLVFQDMNTIGFVFKPWQPPQFWFFFVQDLAYLQLHVPKSWQWLQYSRLGFSSLETFWGK